MAGPTEPPPHQSGKRIVPMQRPEDAEGWEVVARGRDNPNRPPVGTALMVKLSQEDASWVMRESHAAGVTMAAFVTRLIEEAHTRSAPS